MRPSAFTLLNPDAVSPYLLVCDHASNHVPEEMQGLGLCRSELERHIAWDIGAEPVTRKLADLLCAPAVLGGVSRLVVDLNRDGEDASAFPTLSDGTTVPANRELGEAERRARLEAYFQPYHRAIEEQVSRLTSAGVAPILLAIHSFTPVMNGQARPWHVGILSNRDRRLADKLIQALAAEGDLSVGDNQPYSGRDLAYTTNRHAQARGLAHAGIEIRQDLIDSKEKADDWGGRLARILAPMAGA